jgi:hypothetical protein
MRPRSSRARAFFAARGRGFTVLTRAHADADLAAAAAAAGLVAMGEMPAMMLQRRLADAVPPPGVDLRQVTTADDVADYGRVMSAAYATQQTPPDVMPTLLSRLQTLRAPHIVAFVARLDGTPVAGAMTVVTQPESRRPGPGGAAPPGPGLRLASLPCPAVCTAVCRVRCA